MKVQVSNPRDFGYTQVMQTQLLSNEKKGKKTETKNCKCEIQSKRKKKIIRKNKQRFKCEKMELECNDVGGLVCQNYL